MISRLAVNSYLVVWCVLIWTNHCHPTALVTLVSNVTFDDLICTTPAVEFTCIAINTSDVEWQRNGNRIATFVQRDSIGPSYDPRVPPGFEIELTAVEPNSQSRSANFTTTLTADLSVLVNGGDQVSCHSFEGNDSISIEYTGEQPPPPAPLFSPSFSSLRDGEVSLTLTWNKTFTTTHAVQMYCVRSNLCPELCVESDTLFSCDGLVAGGEYMFWVRAVNCGDQEGEESQPLVVRPQVPSMAPSISSVVATYNGSIQEIVVSWEPVPVIQIVDDLPELVWYRVSVDSGRGDPEVVMVNCGQSERTCSAVFSLLEAADYTVSISAVNIVGGSSTRVYPNVIFSSSSSYYDPSFSFENCITSVLCSSSLDLSEATRCEVRYGTDPSYTLLSDPVDAPLNSMFELHLLEPTTTYYFQTRVLINSSLIVEIQEELTTGEFDPRLLSSNIGLITAGAILWTISVILIVISIFLMKHNNEAVKPTSSDEFFKKTVFTMLIISVIFLLLAAIFWIAVGFQVGLQQNTCDRIWQRARNGLIISAFVFSMLPLLLSAVFSFSLSMNLFLSIIRKWATLRGVQQSKQVAPPHHKVPKETVVSPLPDYDYIDTNKLTSSTTVATAKEKIDLDKNKAYGLRPVDVGGSDKSTAHHGDTGHERSQEAAHQLQGSKSPLPEYEYVDTDKLDSSTSKEKIVVDKNKAYGLSLRQVDVGGSSSQREIDLQKNVAYGPTKK